MVSKKIKLFRHAILAAVMMSIASGCAVLDLKQREYIFRASRAVHATPADYGLAFEEVWLKSGTAGERIHAWWIAGPDSAAPALLYLHGSRLNISNNLFRITRMRQMGFSVLAVDYRGFGLSDGELPSEQQSYEDADAAWEEMKRRVADPGHRFIYGHSLGGAVAIDLAVRKPEAAGLIIESTFTSIRDMVGESPYWFVPAGLVLTQHFDSLAKVGKLQTPVLYVHGTADRWVPHSMSQRLHQATAAPKRLLLVEDASHSNVTGLGFERYRAALGEFVAQSRTAKVRKPPLPDSGEPSARHPSPTI